MWECDVEPPGLPGTRAMPLLSTLASTRRDPAPQAIPPPSFATQMDCRWNDWRWQMRNRVTTVRQLEQWLTLSPEERAALEGGGSPLPVAVTPYYLRLVDPVDPTDPLRRSVIPTAHECTRGFEEAEDPLEEERDAPVPGIVHRYPDRVLFLATGSCAVYCRYCTRSRLVGHRGAAEQQRHWDRCLDYIRRRPQIRDVLVSGGDPLTLGDRVLGSLLAELRQIRHVELIRIGTKVPVVLPQRITGQLTRMLRRFHPLWLSIHFTHPRELTPEVATACSRLADAGIPLGSQTVLLKGINDDLSTMRTLFQRLLLLRVRPYYLYQCDPIRGSRHFRTPVDTGLRIIEGLRGHTTGYAVPTFVVDAPGGGGKIALLPRSYLGHEGGDLLLQNHNGHIFRYPDPGRQSQAAGPRCQEVTDESRHYV